MVSGGIHSKYGASGLPVGPGAVFRFIWHRAYPRSTAKQCHTVAVGCQMRCSAPGFQQRCTSRQVVRPRQRRSRTCSGLSVVSRVRGGSKGPERTTNQPCRPIWVVRHCEGPPESHIIAPSLSLSLSSSSALPLWLSHNLCLALSLSLSSLSFWGRPETGSASSWTAYPWQPAVWLAMRLTAAASHRNAGSHRNSSWGLPANKRWFVRGLRVPHQTNTEQRICAP
jgi:hypothetical protein